MLAVYDRSSITLGNDQLHGMTVTLTIQAVRCLYCIGWASKTGCRVEGKHTFHFSRLSVSDSGIPTYAFDVSE